MQRPSRTPLPVSSNGRTFRLMSGLLVCGLAMIPSACDPAGFIASRAGGRLGAAVADQVPTPPAAVSAKPGGNACEVLDTLGWRTVKLGDVTGNNAALSTFGATRDKARACP